MNLNTLSFYIDRFSISDSDTSGDVQYYGYLESTGRWYIMQETVSAGTYRYVFGITGYATAWSGRAGLTYGLFGAW